MPYSVKILADSISPIGARLTTFEASLPRFVHAEFMTHRFLSRNAASSRAIPIEKVIERVMTDPALPKWWGANQKGMQAAVEVGSQAKKTARYIWLRARDQAVARAQEMLEAGIHKQIVNRLLEPWMFITVICSATEYENFFHLRCHPDAQPEIRWIADEMKRLYTTNTPDAVPVGEWHLPLIGPGDVNALMARHHAAPAPSREDTDARLRKISVGRCARVSYLTHDGIRDHDADVALHDRLSTSGHWSPFEHPAQAMDTMGRSGNFVGFRQYRKFFATEHAGRELLLP